MTIEDRLREFILNETTADIDPEALTPGCPLLDSGVLDSLGLLQLVMFIEREYRTHVADEDIVPEHFGTLGGISSLVRSKLEGQSP